MTQLLDTSVLVGMERRRMAPARIVEVAPDEPSAIAAVTVAELLVGAHRADSEVRRRFRERFVREVVAAFEVLNYGLEVAETHASIWATS